jgi:hypothetical protein
VSVQRYQDDFLGSNLPQLSATISRLLSPRPTTLPSQPIPALRLEAALATVRGALAASHVFVSGAQSEIDGAWRTVDSLRDHVAEVRAKAEKEVFGETEADKVQEAFAGAEKHVRRTVDNIRWWQLLYKADDVTYLVWTAIRGGWCQGLSQDACVLLFLSLPPNTNAAIVNSLYYTQDDWPRYKLPSTPKLALCLQRSHPTLLCILHCS